MSAHLYVLAIAPLRVGALLSEAGFAYWRHPMDGRGRPSKYNYNREFFRDWSASMAWVLGLVYSDGYVGEYGLVWKWANVELCQKVLALVEADFAPKLVDNNGKDAYAIEFWSKEIVESLMDLGLPCGKKSGIISFPPSMPHSYIRHFVRGFFDGDGCVDLHNGKPRVQITSIATHFLEEIEQCLFSLGLGRRPVYTYMRPSRMSPQGTTLSPYAISYLTYSRRSHIHRLYHVFYDGVSEKVYYQRKRDVFDNHWWFHVLRARRGIDNATSKFIDCQQLSLCI